MKLRGHQYITVIRMQMHSAYAETLGVWRKINYQVLQRKTKKQQKIVNLMGNKRPKMHSPHGKTRESKLNRTTVINEKDELGKELSIAPDKITE